MMARRSSHLLPALVLGACLASWSYLRSTEMQSFVSMSVSGASHVRSRVAMKSFKDEFLAWKQTLTPEEQKLVQKQAQNEFNKKFRDSEEYGKDLSDEKQASFTKILSKFFESEAENYKKEQEARPPEYDALLKKTKGKAFDMSLKSAVVEVDRDADRRYYMAWLKNNEAAKKGEKYPAAACIEDEWVVANDSDEEHEANKKVFEEAKASFKGKDEDGIIAKGVPPKGTRWVIHIPRIPMQRLQTRLTLLEREIEEKGNLSKAEFDPSAAFEKEVQGWIEDTKEWQKASSEVQSLAEDMKKFYRSAKVEPGQTKADILKEVWKVLPSLIDKPLPPLDEETLAELAQYPAKEDDFRHPWGIADKLYKSEAIDAFGQRYLLGIYETPQEAQKAFASWNAEYEKARVAMKAEMQEWGKQEAAKLEADKPAQDRIKAMLEEARR